MSDLTGASSKGSALAVFAANIPDFLLPTLPLPRNTWAGSFVNSHIYNRKTKQKTADVPTADPIISEFGKEYLVNRFTVKFVEYVVANNYSKHLVFSNDQAAFGLEFSRRLNRFGMLEIDPNADKIREVLSFYLTNVSFLINNVNVQKLKARVELIEAKYKSALSNLTYQSKDELKKLNSDEADSFIKNAEDTINKHVDDLFKNSGSDPTAINAVKDNVQLTDGLLSVTSEILIRINPSLSAERAAELAPYINKCIAESKVTTLVGEAMFIAQILHEVGLRKGLDENGAGTAKVYGGKKYPYFFYMYDKESPNPDKQKVARILGNTEAGDGEKFHGRGYIQLTGRDKYTRAGSALGYDFINNPALAADPNAAVKTTAWYWLGGNGRNCNDYTQKDSDSNFVQITKIINGGTNGLDDRRRLYKNAKQALGVK